MKCAGEREFPGTLEGPLGRLMRKDSISLSKTSETIVAVPYVQLPISRMSGYVQCSKNVPVLLSARVIISHLRTKQTLVPPKQQSRAVGRKNLTLNLPILYRTLPISHSSSSSSPSDTPSPRGPPRPESPQ